MHIIYFIVLLEKRKDDVLMKAKEKRYIAIYARKSKLTLTGESIAIQIDKCQNYIRSLPEYDDNTKIKTYQDEGYSGETSTVLIFKNFLLTVWLIKFLLSFVTVSTGSAEI